MNAILRKRPEGAATPLIVPGVYDVLSARVTEEVGFEAMYLGSYATSASQFGKPDIGFIGLADMADQTRRITDVTSTPLIVDAENGWGNPVHIINTVRTLEKAGAAAIHIEDHEFGKHLIENPVLKTPTVMMDNLKAALDARVSEDFGIIARTDASFGEGVDRVLEYQDSGVDAVLVAGWLHEEDWQRLSPYLRVPLVYCDMAEADASFFAERGVDVLLHWGTEILAAAGAVRSTLQALKETGGSGSVTAGIPTYDVVDRLLGTEAATAVARQYAIFNEAE